jgi:uncharacterized protein (UPF0548 family)
MCPLVPRLARAGLRHDRVMLPAVLTPEVARRLRDAELTYCAAGQTAGILPPGYHHLRTSAIIGAGPEAFAGAAQALFSWQVQLRAGLRVASPSAMAQPGAVVLVGLRAGPILIGAPCRVVYVVRGPHRCGFALQHRARTSRMRRGSLHPPAAQRRDGDGHHHRLLHAGALLAKATGPAGRAIQRRITTRYLNALTS